jgi:hypothetical protein
MDHGVCFRLGDIGATVSATEPGRIQIRVTLSSRYGTDVDLDGCEWSS